MAEVPMRTPKNSDGSNNGNRPVVKQIAKAKIQKPSTARRAVNSMVNDDVRNVKEYLIFDVLIPAAKNTISDLVSTGVERLLFGGDSKSLRSTSRREYTGYGRVYGSSRRPGDAPGNSSSFSRRAREAHDFDQIILETRSEAEDVLIKLDDICKKYDVATVGDLYGMVGISQSYTDENWGWHDLSSARVVRHRNGYILDLPKPEDVR